MLYKTELESPIGKLTAVSDGVHIVGLWIEGQKYFMHSVREETADKADLKVFADLKNWLKRYFAGEKTSPDALPLLPRGSKFQQDVWQILCRIPYGEVVTYKQIAKQIAEKQGKKTVSAQAVGGAVGHNPISIIIPCHRVVGSDGHMTGYAGGIPLKIKLLKLEGVKTDGERLKGKGEVHCF